MRRDWTQAQTDFAADLYQKSFTGSHIARAMSKQFGTYFSRGSVLGRLKRMGVLRPYDLAPKRNQFGDSKPREAKVTTLRGLKSPPQMELVLEAIGPLNDFPPIGKCRHIAGDVQAGDWRCCGHDALPNSAWCAHHHARMYIKAAAARPMVLQNRATRVAA